MNNSFEIPPVPDCFSHLVVDDVMCNNEHGLQCPPDSEVNHNNIDSNELTTDHDYGCSLNSYNKTFTLKDAQSINNGDSDKFEELAKESLNLNVIVKSSTTSQASTKGPFEKLNTAFTTLQKEMVSN